MPDIFPWVVSLKETIDTLNALAPDPNKEPLIAWLQEGVERGDGRSELRSYLRGLASTYTLTRYLEIGVRRGWSLAQVVKGCPDIWVDACDMWIPDYAGTPNPGPEFVLDEIKRVAPEFAGTIQFFSCSSRELQLTGDYDLITVDGDHSVDGALADLRMCMQHLAPGGYLLFDDLVENADGGGSLRDVWEQIKQEYPDRLYEEKLNSIVPFGKAYRRLDD